MLQVIFGIALDQTPHLILSIGPKFVQHFYDDNINNLEPKKVTLSCLWF